MPRSDKVNPGAQFTNLRQFTNWYWRNGQPYLPPEDPYRRAPATHSLVLFRAGQFQVEQVTLFPDFVIPVHFHPNVQTYECHIVGKGDAWLWDKASGFQSFGRWRKVPYTTRKDKSPKYKRLLIDAGQPHRGKAHTVNVALSFQHWLNDREPSFIADDWQQPDQCLWKEGLRAFA